MSEITFEQFVAIRNRNILSEPPFVVINKSYPLGSISFEVVGDNLKHKTVTIPGDYAPHDLTHFASLDSLLSSSSIKSLLDKGMIALLNPEVVVDPDKSLEKPVIDQLTEGDLVVTGKTVPNASLSFVQGNAVATGTSDAEGEFSISLSTAAVAGEYSLTVSASGYSTMTFVYQAAVAQTPEFPKFHVDTVTYRDTVVTGTALAGANVTTTIDGKKYSTTVDDQGKFSLAVDSVTFAPFNLRFTASGYNPVVVPVTPQELPAIVVTQDSANPTQFLDTKVVGTTEPNIDITVAVKDQETKFVRTGTDGAFSVDVDPIKGDITFAASTEGYSDESSTVTPALRKFGDLTVATLSQSTETVTGSVAGYNSQALATCAVHGTESRAQNIADDGTFSVADVDLSTLTSVDIVLSSQYYTDAVKTVPVLKEFTKLTLDDIVQGSPVTGTTDPNTNIVLVQGANTVSGKSNAQGQFSVDFDNVQQGELDVTLNQEGYLEEKAKPTISVMVRLVPTAVHEYDETFSALGTPGAHVVFTQGSNIAEGNVGADGKLSLSLTTPVVSGDYTVVATLADYKDNSQQAGAIAI